MLKKDKYLKHNFMEMNEINDKGNRLVDDVYYNLSDSSVYVPFDIDDASADVYNYKPTKSFTINGQDAGEGFDPKGRIQLGFNIPKVIRNVNIYGEWYMETPPVYGFYKVHAEGGYYATWGLEQMSHDMHNVWVQYNDGEHPFIPPVISVYDSLVKTWFRYDIYKADNVYAGGGILGITNASLQEYNISLERKYQTMIFDVLNQSCGEDWIITLSSSSSYIYP